VSRATKRLRFFLDSNVLTGGLVARWGLDRAVLSLCAARVCRLVLAEAIQKEVEENLILHAAGLPEPDASAILDDYTGLVRLTRPELIPYPEESEVLASQRLIAHAADVPVLLSAVAAKPNWLLTHNTKHFTPAVAMRTGLRIAPQ
jgi:hypothetical protein